MEGELLEIIVTALAAVFIVIISWSIIATWREGER